VNRPAVNRLRFFLRSESGQVIPMMAVMLSSLLAMAALSLDVGREMYASRALQAATDAAALAGARALATATTTSSITGPGGVVAQYSAATGGLNANPNTLPAVTVTSSLKCLNTLVNEDIFCTGSLPYNAVQVTETSTVPMYFLGLLHHSSETVTSTATAAMRGGSPRSANIAIILDTTLSMLKYDADCGNTQMQCALNGVQILLQNFNPCSSNQATCTIISGNSTNSFNRVSLFTFPNVSVATASIDSSCTQAWPTPTLLNGFQDYPPYGTISVLPNALIPWSGLPTALPYSFPIPGASSYAPSGSLTPTYQITPFLSDYRTSDTAATLNTSSALVKAAGAVPYCNSMMPPNYDGMYGTYYAGVIYAAQSALTAEQVANPGSENVMILLSDGDSTSPQTWTNRVNNQNFTYFSMSTPAPSNKFWNATGNGLYPSWYGECGQAITAAQAATTAGTIVYSVAYGSPSTGCSTDANQGAYPNISPCDTMADIASAPQYFFSDYKQTGSNSTCFASQPVTALSDIFQSIAIDITNARLIPNNTP
jgi:Flp pilus assembly protein TadG